jgi:hypothetical protein
LEEWRHHRGSPWNNDHKLALAAAIVTATPLSE